MLFLHTARVQFKTARFYNVRNMFSDTTHFYFMNELGGKKNRQKERRLMKGFNLANVGGSAGSQPGLTCSTPSLAGSSTIPVVLGNACSRASMQTLNETNELAPTASQSLNKGNAMRSPITKLAQLARLAGAKKADSKKRWGNLIEAAKSAKGVSRMWTRSRSRSEDSVSSDGSGGTAAQAQDDVDSITRRDKFTKSRTGYPVVHVTENELPAVLAEVLEESGIDYELSGRMGMDSINTHSPISNLRHFRRACSEPADQVTLILEAESLSTERNEEATNMEAYPCSIVNLSNPQATRAAEQSSSGVNLRFRRSGELVSSPVAFTTSVRSRDWMAGQNLPFVDDSAETSIHIGNSPMETVFKSFNGVSFGVHETTVSGDTISGIQSLGNNSSGGWL